MNQEQEIHDLKTRQALLEQRMDGFIKREEKFQAEVLEKLEYFQRRDIKVFQFIETEMENKNASKELKQAVLSKLLTSGAWAAIVFVSYVLWQYLTNYLHKAS